MPQSTIRVVALSFVLSSIYAVLTAAQTPLQPAVYRVYPAGNGSTSKANRSLAGLLKRQNYCDSGYGYCSNTGVCCPLGGKCCSNGHCCDPGSWCSSPGHCCYNNQNSCESIGCCYTSEECCGDGGCCPSGSYCILGTNGVGGCCPNGETCYGPVGGGGGGSTGGGSSGGNGGGSSGGGNSGGNGGGSGGHTSSSSKTTPTPTSTTSSSTAQFQTSSSSSVSSTPAVAPLPDVGYNNVIIGATDPQITWSAGGWTVGPASCDGSQRSKKTTKPNQWFTFITPSNTSSSIYLDASWNGATFTIFINGLQSSSLTLSSLTDCQYHQIGPINPGVSSNVTVYVYGPAMSGRQVGSSGVNWSFEFNSFAIGEKSSSSSGGFNGSSSSATRNNVQGKLAVTAYTLLFAAVLLLV